MASFTHERGRPVFNSMKTSDRLRECEKRPSSSLFSTTKPKRRLSAFKELGLDDLNSSVYQHHRYRLAGSLQEIEEEQSSGEKKVTFDDILKDIETIEENEDVKKKSTTWLPRIRRGTTRPTIKMTSSAPPATFSTLPRVALIAFLIAVVVPGLRYAGDEDKINISGVNAGVMRVHGEFAENGSVIEGRQNSPTDVCTRWSHQTANVNGTIYIYGGEATQESGQTENFWNNNFMTLDVTKTWQISTPALSGLPQPSGPPAVAEGRLWHTFDSLFLYGGEFSDSPPASPLPVSTWQYDIPSGAWTEFSDPQTAAGNNSDGGSVPVQRSAEGSGVSVPELGRSWYFGGHLDLYTTKGWSIQIARVYLKSLLEFTHPGYANSGVESLGTTTAAPSGGVYRNITQGGLQVDAGFTERADGVLVYVPGWGSEGILLGLAGGTNETFTEMNIIDIYDIASSTWYQQSTSGATPPIRVNPCAVVAAAPDGSSFNIYLYGGQNLIPYGSQMQYSDMWILTIPSFTWIEVDMTGQSQPPARAGHTCDIWDSQMIVVGGYVGKDISCDSPGIYVFNTSSLEWTNSFTSLGTSDSSSDSPSEESGVLQGSRGYQVPALIQSVIGGSSLGGATVTSPIAGATTGPIATGRPPPYTVTQAASTVLQSASTIIQSGSTVFQTAQETTTSTTAPTPNKAPLKATNKAAIVAGVIAAVLGILAAYLAFCTWLYRRQLALYKNHVAMAQRTSFAHGESSSSHQDGSDNGRITNEKMGAALGPFGMDGCGGIGNGSGSGSGSISTAPARSPSLLTPVSATAAGADTAYHGPGGMYGGGSMPGGGTAGRGYIGRLSEEVEGENGGGSAWRGSASSRRSSTEDLLGGQEPSFFSVIMNPRRTLRVVNLD
ncbi:hypothetical protein B7494_g3772 [Chlorociboria aeruginascens]|nr:hypothetical protein B7494_g3772 [Chlorociboria aeruginascens]